MSLLKTVWEESSLPTKSQFWSHERHWCHFVVADQTSGPRDTPGNNGPNHRNPACRRPTCLWGWWVLLCPLPWALCSKLERVSNKLLLFKVKFINWSLRPLCYEKRSWSRIKSLIIWQGSKAFTITDHSVSQHAGRLCLLLCPRNEFEWLGQRRFCSNRLFSGPFVGCQISF